MSEQELIDRLKHCPMCGDNLTKPSYTPIHFGCFLHGDFVVPVLNQGAPIVWEFVARVENLADNEIMELLKFCPFCAWKLTFNSNWKVKNCDKLHGDIRVRQGKATFDFDEPDYEIVLR